MLSLSAGAVRASSVFPILSVTLLFFGGLCVAASEFHRSRHNVILSAGIFFVSAGEHLAPGPRPAQTPNPDPSPGSAQSGQGHVCNVRPRGPGSGDPEGPRLLLVRRLRPLEDVAAGSPAHRVGWFRARQGPGKAPQPPRSRAGPWSRWRRPEAVRRAEAIFRKGACSLLPSCPPPFPLSPHPSVCVCCPSPPLGALRRKQAPAGLARGLAQLGTFLPSRRLGWEPQESGRGGSEGLTLLDWNSGSAWWHLRDVTNSGLTREIATVPT